MGEAVRLKPCPFCGGEASESEGRNEDGKPWLYVECIDCAAMADVDVWNKRYDPAKAIFEDMQNKAKKTARGDKGE